MIKILETINEKPNQSKLIELLKNIKMDGLTVTGVEFDDYLSEKIVINFDLTVTILKQNTINDFHHLVVNTLKENGYITELGNYVISMKNITFEHPSGFSMGWAKFIPTHVINQLKHYQPTLREIDQGHYSIVLPQNPITDNSEELPKIIDIKKKYGETYYKVYKKGKVGEHTYELIDNPTITVDYRGGFRKELEMRSFTPEIETKLKSIDGNENFPRELYLELEQEITNKFKKHGIFIIVLHTSFTFPNK
jgi:hypothetical protein